MATISRPVARLPRPKQVAGVTVRVWATERTRRALPLLVVHDGRGYARRAGLFEVLRPAPALTPLRIALLDTADRDEDYSASAAYARRLVRDVLPSLPPATARIGLGASLGALALLHAHVRAPGAFAGLFLQSGSFFRLSTDRQERGFPRFGRISRFVAQIERSAPTRVIPITMTCGTEEENLANNRHMRDTLATRGYPVRLHEVPGGHDWPAWRGALAPQLLDLIREATA